MSKIQRSNQTRSLADHTGLTFNFAMALPGRASSLHTQRAYFRWVDTFLVDIAGLEPTKGDKRTERMSRLSISVLRDNLSAQQLRAWLGVLGRRGHGKQGLDQARASIVTLTDLLAEAEWIDDYTAAAMARVRPPRAEDGQRPGRWLSIEQIQMLMVAGREIATSENQSIRNNVTITMLCTMALRREELSVAKWGDLSIQNNRVVLRVHGKGRKVAVIDVPKPVIRALDRWRSIVAPGETRPPAHSPLVRRIWKGGKVSRSGLSADGIWFIVTEAAKSAHIDHVAPHDLRRSVAGALYDSGVPVDKITRLLRHSSIAVTEKYLSKLPRINEGAVLMSDLLGLNETDTLWSDNDE